MHMIYVHDQTVKGISIGKVLAYRLKLKIYIYTLHAFEVHLFKDYGTLSQLQKVLH